jgi:glutamine amidotransferase
MNSKIMIIDYGCGNVESIKRGFDKINIECQISDVTSELKLATHLILPGVGAFKNAMKSLKNKNFLPIILDHYKKNKPLLGICLGMQLLFTKSNEFGETKGLDIFKGKVCKLNSDNDKKYKIPNIGWYKLQENLEAIKDNNITELNNGEYYHVHSYHCKPIDTKKITHQIDFNNNKVCVSYRDKNVVGVQFHPEKSRNAGLDFLNFFASMK